MADMTKVQFVCVRAVHHRRTTRSDAVCEHLGCASYCPAGDVGGHDWMPALTDLASLRSLGYVLPRDDTAEADAGSADEEPVLIR